MDPSTIWKFEIPTDDVARIPMPRGARLLSVGQQGETMVAWAAVEPKAERVTRQLAVIGTGWPNYEIPTVFVGTIMLAGGSLVFHIFDLGEMGA